MQPNILEDLAAKAPWSVIHPLSEEDSAAVAALRSVVAPMKASSQESLVAVLPGLMGGIVQHFLGL